MGLTFFILETYVVIIFYYRKRTYVDKVYFRTNTLCEWRNNFSTANGVNFIQRKATADKHVARSFSWKKSWISRSPRPSRMKTIAEAFSCDVRNK